VSFISSVRPVTELTKNCCTVTSNILTHNSSVFGTPNASLFPLYESLSILPPVSASAILWILSWLTAM
jgi:hypothetical protein